MQPKTNGFYSYPNWITCPRCVRRSPKSPNEEHLRLASCHLLVVPSIQLDTYGTAVGHSPWLVRPSEQQPAWSRTQHCQLRSPIEDAFVSAVFGASSALEALCDNVLYKLTLTLTLNWLGHREPIPLCQSKPIVKQRKPIAIRIVQKHKNTTSPSPPSRSNRGGNAPEASTNKGSQGDPHPERPLLHRHRTMLNLE